MGSTDYREGAGLKKIGYAALREPSYVRNELNVRALRSSYSVELLASNAASYTARMASVFARAAFLGRDCDVAVAGFLGQPLVPALRLLGHDRVVLDAFVSVYDTLCNDRQTIRRGFPAGAAAWLLDLFAVRLCSRVVVDTESQKAWFSSRFELPEDRIDVVYLGYDPLVFAGEDRKWVRRRDSQIMLEVFTYGSYLPLHGFDVIVEAARLLQSDRQLHFTLVGTGQRRARVEAMARSANLRNLDFLDWIPYRQLPDVIGRSDILLGGHFGLSGKASRVIAGKAYQYAAMGKAMILGNGPANHEIFDDGVDALYCRRGDAESLADAIVELARDADLRQALGESARERVRPLAGIRQATTWRRVIERVLDRPV